MLWRLVAKLLFKASLPLIALAGVFTYGVYMRGGDPAAMWAGVASKGIAQVSSLFSGVRDDAGRAVGAVSSTLGSSGSVGSEQTHVFTWQDAEGVTHYSTTAPEDIEAKTVTVNPNVNILAPVRAPLRQPQSGETDVSTAGLPRSIPGVNRVRTNGESSGSSGLQRGHEDGLSPGAQAVADELGGTLPGVAGQVLSTQSGEPGSALDPTQLIKMLQAN